MRTLSLALFALFAACGGTSISEQTCSRIDECNALATSMKECVERIDNILDHATATDRDEVELQLDRCLEHPACNAFLTCFDTVGSSANPTGGGGGGGGGPGDPPPPPPPPPTPAP
jgi:hypothetical protein